MSAIRGAAPEGGAASAPHPPGLPARGPLHLRAHAVADRIDIAALDLGEALVRRPLVVAAGERGLAIVFRYGALVTVELSPDEERAVLDRVLSGVTAPFRLPERESMVALVDPDVQEERVDDEGRLALRGADLERLQVVAEALAKSALLAHHEGRMVDTFDRIEPLAERMRSGRAPGGREGPLLSQLGEVLLNQIRTTGRVEVTEKPELTWERPDLDRLWGRLVVELELVERERALSRKLQLATDISGTVVDLVMERRTLRVEWYIVLLIVFEIVLVLLEMAGVI